MGRPGDGFYAVKVSDEGDDRRIQAFIEELKKLPQVIAAIYSPVLKNQAPLMAGTDSGKWESRRVVAAADINSSALLHLDLTPHRLLRPKPAFADEFQPCPWATQVNGVNTEECRSFKVAVVNNDSHVYEVNLASGHVGELRHLVHAPGVEIFEAGVSEAEDEILLTAARQLFDYERVPRTDGIVGWTYANSHSTQDQCQASWHSVPPGGGDAVQQLRVPTPDMCFSIFGGGTISPSVVRRLHGLVPPLPLAGH